MNSIQTMLYMYLLTVKLQKNIRISRIAHVNILNRRMFVHLKFQMVMHSAMGFMILLKSLIMQKYSADMPKFYKEE